MKRSATMFVEHEADLNSFAINDKVIVAKPTKYDLETEGIAKLILNNLNNYPDFIGQINAHTGEKTTFAQIKDRSVRCALWLKKQGIAKGDIVSMSIPVMNDDYIPCLATLFIGAIFSPWCNSLNPDEARYFFNLIQPKIMFTWDEEIDQLVSAARDTGVHCKFIVVGRHSDYPSLDDVMAEQSQVEVDEFIHVDPEDPKKQIGGIFFSSGTTGVQKAALLSYELLAKNRTYNMIPRSNMNILMYSALSWITGTILFTLCIRLHLTRVLHLKFDPEETCEVMEKYKVNIALLHPSKVSRLCKLNSLKKHNFSQLETILLAGSKPLASIIERALQDFPNTFISNAYGLTETGGLLSFQTKKYNKLQSIGRIVGGMQLKIVDTNSGCSLGANQEGELCFKLDNVMIGYLKNEKETKLVIDDDGWLHTGDLGFYDEAGEVTITDRIKNFIFVGSDHLYPTEVEEILMQHPDVVDAAVIPIPHPEDYERPFAFIVKRPGSEVTADELKKLPASYHDYYLLTGGVIFIDEIPCTAASGKKSIRVLKEMALNYVKNKDLV